MSNVMGAEVMITWYCLIKWKRQNVHFNDLRSPLIFGLEATKVNFFLKRLRWAPSREAP